MKYYKCPSCKRERFYEEKLVMKICVICQKEMEVLEDCKR